MVEVRVYETDDGSYTFKDNYYHCYMAREAVEYFENILSMNSASVKVRFSNAVWSDILGEAKTFNEWVALGTSSVDVFVITNETITDEEQNNYVNIIADNKIEGMVYFFTTNDEDLLKNKTVSEILNNSGELTTGESEYYINSKFEVSKK